MEKLGIINLETGEIVEDRLLVIGKKARYIEKDNHVKIFVSFLSDLVESDKIAGKSIRLLFYMLEHLQFDTLEIKIIPQDAIEQLGIHKDTFYRWIKDLVDFGIIEKKNRYTYVLKPYTFVKGNVVKAYENYLNKVEKQVKRKNKGGEKNG